MCLSNSNSLSKHQNFELKIISYVMLPLGVWSFLVCAGKDTKFDPPLISADTNKTRATVLKLVQHLLKQGQTVWMDNLYNSSCLAKTIKTVHKTGCLNRLILNKKNVPRKCNIKLKIKVK
jgi:hypothetical protein